MAENDDPIVRAIQHLEGTIVQQSEGKEIGESSKYIKELIDEIADLSQALSGREITKTDLRRGSNAYLNSDRRMGAFNALPPEEKRSPWTQTKYGVRETSPGQYEAIKNPLSLRRNIGELNIPQIQSALSEGHLFHAGRMFVTGLTRTPYADMLAAPQMVRAGASALDFARNRVVSQQLGQPNTLGMSTGARGPGAEDFSSGLGSYIASLTAFPSMFMNKTGTPMGMFGTSMAPAVSRGYQMRKEAFTRSLNPFDMMGYQQNLELIQATGSKGFGTLSQTFKISDIAKDLMQTIGADTGTIIDTLDIAVKRLHTDVTDAADQMKEFGAMATSAGKGVAQFSKETLEVLNQMSLSGARGPGALSASALMSSIPQVSGMGVYGALNNPMMTGLMVGGLGGQQFSTTNAMTAMLGSPNAMFGGTRPLQVQSAQMQAFLNSSKMFTGPMGEQAGLAAMANMMGMDITAVQQMYNQAPRVIKEAGQLQRIQDVKTGLQGSMFGKIFGGKGGGRKLGDLRGTGKEAFMNFQKRFAGKGKGERSPMGGAYLLGGLNFTDPLGGNGFEFNQAIGDVLNASESERSEIYARLQEKGMNTAEISNIVESLEKAGKGTGKESQRAFAQIFKDYDVTTRAGTAPKNLSEMLGGVGTLSSKALKKGGYTEAQWKTLSDQERQSFINSRVSALNKLTTGEDPILEKDSESYREYIGQIKAGKFDFSKLEKDVITRSNIKTQAIQDAYGRQIVGLTEDAMKGIGIAVKEAMPNKPASDQGG